MPPDFRRFALLPLPQYFDGSTLSLNIVVLPRNQNPLSDAIEQNGPTVPDAPSFADAQLSFDAKIITGLGNFPNTLSTNDTRSLTVTRPSNVRPLFQALANQFQISPLNTKNIDLSANPDKAPAAVNQDRSVKKYLPLSYRSAFNFTNPRTPNAVTDDSYYCAIRNAGKVPGFPVSSDVVSWGRVFAYALRQPLLGQELGMIYTTQLEIKPTDYPLGGWLYVDLAEGSDYLAQQQAVDQYNTNNGTQVTFAKRYAARLPALAQGKARQVFAPLLFPVLFKAHAADPDPVPDGNYDQLIIESSDYDDGFAKIAHAQQPPSSNLLSEVNDGAHPVHDVGIRLGWDDEQILIWYMRQMTIDPTVSNLDKRIDAPLSVFGYAIDVRDVTGGAGAWNSLNRVKSKAPLAVSNGTPIILGKFDNELAYQVYPSQIDGDQSDAFWLPMYFANWNGHTMVLPDPDAAALYQTTNPGVNADPQTVIPVAKQDPTDPEYPNKKTGTGASGPAKKDLNKIYKSAPIHTPLRYGHEYEFRMRLRDVSGGGTPLLPTIQPINTTPSNIAKCHFKRFVAPNQVRSAVPLPFNTDSPSNFTQLQLQRPWLNYPAVIYTGKYTHPIARLQAASNALLGQPPNVQEAFGIPDPDVDRVQITVEVQTLRMDNLQSVSGTENYVLLYTTKRAFPKVNTEDDYAATLNVPIVYRDCHVLHTGAELDLKNDLGVDNIDTLAEIVVPTGRTIRLTLRALCEKKAADGDYYGSLDEKNPDMDSRFGHISQLWLYQPSTDETELFDTLPAQMVQGIYLQPDPPYIFDGNPLSLFISKQTDNPPDLVQRLAKQIGVEVKGMTLSAEQGERVQFGCSNRIRHTLSPEHSSITFATKGDLLNHWLCVLSLDLNRDWTWDALQDTSFVITRTVHFTHDDATEIDSGEIGTIEVRHTASLESLQNPQRDYTRLIFIDAVEPKNPRFQPSPHQTELRFPDTIDVSYTITTQFKTGHGAQHDPDIKLTLSLPITTPPAQIPKVASAGIALSPYRRNAKYSATEPRRRYLWVEFAEPIRDPQDTYFARVLASAPDQLISNNELDLIFTPQEPALPIDAELIRVIPPSASNDLAGLNAMQPMQKAADSDKHYLLPFPPGISADAPELFGFFTYEFRVGHYGVEQIVDGNQKMQMAWTTAQGRFGRPLRATGIQHPAPTLTCVVNRDPDKLYVSAPYAVAVFNGKNVTADPPRTQLWCLLYAQVRQADYKDYRNILLDDKPLDWRVQIEFDKDVNLFTRYNDQQRSLLKAVTINSWNDELDYANFQHVYKLVDNAQLNKDATKYGTTVWGNAEIKQLLELYGLPSDLPLSVLVVEILPTITNIYEAIPGLGQEGVRNAVRDNLRVTDLPEAGVIHETMARLNQEAQFRPPPDPLSEELGQHRILRTSPLTEVPYVC